MRMRRLLGLSMSGVVAAAGVSPQQFSAMGIRIGVD